MEIKKANTQSDYFSVMMIRTHVFMCEQSVDPMIELDEEDKTCHHYLLINEEQPIGCLRVIEQDKDTWHLGRIAILKEYRSKHFGSFLLEQIEKMAKEKNIKKLELGAQIQALSFYERNGFARIGNPYEEANIQHLNMEKVI